jgi:hypothetical protein
MIKLIKRLFKGRTKQCNIQNVVCSASSEKKQNPYMLLWYKQGWSEKRIAINNSKYWQWEIEHNGFRP